MRNFNLTLRFLAIGLTVCIYTSCSDPKDKPLPETTPPNVLFILVDDLGWQDLSYTGSDFYESPNLDRLAARSYVFQQAYSAHPVCSPTRAALLTGRHPTRIGITDWIPGNNPTDRNLAIVQDLDQLPLKEVTLAEMLANQGYQTFFAGKWHLGDEGFLPEDQGFEINKGGLHFGRPPGGYYSPYGNPKLPDGPPGEYLTDRLTDETIAFMKEERDRPFFAYLSYYTVHTPIQACERHLARFQKKRDSLQIADPKLMDEGRAQTVTQQYNADYASMIYAMDENVGRLLDHLEALGIDDETLVIFTSDNGGLSTLEASRRTIPPTSVRPLRAGKGWAYEGGIRVPLLIHRPDSERSTTISAPVVSMDLVSTILEELNIPPTESIQLDGRSLTPIMNSVVDSIHEVLFWDYPHYHGSGWTPGQAIRKGHHKLVYFFETDTYELYDLSKDPSEATDIATLEPEILKTLISELTRQRAKFATHTPARRA